MNTEVFLSKLRKGEPFVIEILEDGKILCGDRNFYEYVMSIYREIRKKYVRKGEAWIKNT